MSGVWKGPSNFHLLLTFLYEIDSWWFSVVWKPKTPFSFGHVQAPWLFLVSEELFNWYVPPYQQNTLFTYIWIFWKHCSSLMSPLRSRYMRVKSWNQRTHHNWQAVKGYFPQMPKHWECRIKGILLQLTEICQATWQFVQLTKPTLTGTGRGFSSSSNVTNIRGCMAAASVNSR